MKRYIPILALLLSLLPLKIFAATSAEVTGKTATELFTKVYNSVFGKQGSSLSYSVNIIGLYKTQGTIVYKQDKVHYKEKRYMAWEDGVTAYMVDKKKKRVGIYDMDDDNKDKYLSKFKFDVKDFDISYHTEGDYYMITAKVRKSSYFGVREAVAKVLKSNLHPVALTVKLAFLQTTVKITNFKSGGISDSQFTFPRKLFADYEFVDNRKK